MTAPHDASQDSEAIPGPPTPDQPTPDHPTGDHPTGGETSSGRSTAGPDLAARVHVRRPGGFLLDVDARFGPVVTVLVGPNGSGKSTLLAALAGTVALDGADDRIALGDRGWSSATHHLPLHDRRVGLLFQDPILLPHLDLCDNVAFAAAGGRRITDAHRRAALAALADVGIDRDLPTARPAGVSGGQAQRAALARALVTRPDVLLLDEPLSAVDATGRQELRGLLRQHLRGFAGPVVVVTHDLADVATLADRVVVLEDGRVVADDDLPALATRPGSPFVADLVGINLYRGVADGFTTTVHGRAGDTTITTADSARGDVHVAFPPRAVALFRTPPDGSPRNAFRVRVTRIDPLGDRLRIHLAGDLDLVAEVTPAAAAELDLAASPGLHAIVKATEVEVYHR